MAHGAGPRADHFLRLAPAAVDDDEGIEQLRFPVTAAARLAPGQRRKRRDHRPHVFGIVDHLAVARLDPPQRQHGVAIDAVFALDAREQRRKFLGARLAGDDAPVGDAAIDILPQRFAEFGLGADLGVDGGIGLDAIHHAPVGRLRYAARGCAMAKRFAPRLEGTACAQGGDLKRDRGSRAGGGQCAQQKCAAADG
jgi:hypothetical protein